MFAMIGAFSEFEREMTRERVVSGLDNARKKGRIGGRPSNLTDEIRSKIVELKGAGVSIRKIKDACSVGTATVYKVLREGNPVPKVSVGI
jgi:DNA invertase Pin-like site-specific DNA recombinase